MNVESNNIDDFDFSKILKAYSEGVIGISAEYKPARPHDQGPKQFLENPVFTKIMFEEFMNKPLLNPREKAKLEKLFRLKILHMILISIKKTACFNLLMM